MDNTDKLEFDFEFEDKWDFNSTLDRELRHLGGEWVIPFSVVTLGDDGLPLFGETVITEPTFKTSVTITLWKRGGGFKVWEDRDGNAKVFPDKASAEKFRSKVADRIWKGRTSISEDRVLISKGKCHYSINSDTYNKLLRLKKEHHAYIHEDPEWFQPGILDITFEDERDNAKLEKIKVILRNLKEIRDKKDAEERAEWEAKQALEAERMSHPLYRVFKIVDAWDIESKEFKEIEKLSTQLHKEAEWYRNRPADFYSKDRGTPYIDERDYPFYGDPGWYDE